MGGEAVQDIPSAVYYTYMRAKLEGSIVNGIGDILYHPEYHP